MSTLGATTRSRLSMNELDIPVQCRLCVKKFFKPGGGFFNLFAAWEKEWDGMEALVVDDLNRLTNIGVSSVGV